MAAREEAEENYHSGCGVPDNGVDVLPDHGYKNNCTKDLGPVQYTGHFKSMKETCARPCMLISSSHQARHKLRNDTEICRGSTIQTKR